MSAFLHWVAENDLLAIFVSIIALIFAQAFKPLVKKAIEKYKVYASSQYELKNGEGTSASVYTEKWSQMIISLYVTLIVAFISFIAVMLWYVLFLKAGSSFISNTSFWIQLLAAITLEQAIYKAYEGVGNISLKQLIRNIIKNVAEKNKNNALAKFLYNNTDTIVDVVDQIIPLTPSGKENLHEALVAKKEEVKQGEEE